jgi:hypothetical protein
VVVHCQRAVADWLGALQRPRQRFEVVDLALGEFRDHVDAPEAQQLAHEIIGQVAEKRSSQASSSSAHNTWAAAFILCHPF